MKTYSEKLKDPRWQKKRLEILNRDNFTCRNCRCTDKTLHVHHVIYSGEPWDVKNEYLITLCESCHKIHTKLDKERISDLVLGMKKTFDPNRLHLISYILSGLRERGYKPEKVFQVFAHVFSEEGVFERIWEERCGLLERINPDDFDINDYEWGDNG